MSDLQSTSSILIALTAAITGSLHCIGMCGPLRLLTHTSPLSYQVGRLFAYTLLGSVAGWVGFTLPIWALVALVALWICFQFIRRPSLLSKLRSHSLDKFSDKPLLLGLVSGLLPCGMLHAWIAVAAATRSPVQGGLMLGVLWLGTTPALEASGRLLKLPFQKARSRYPRLVPFLLLALALVPIGMRLTNDTNKNESNSSPTCHHQH